MPFPNTGERKMERRRAPLLQVSLIPERRGGGDSFTREKTASDERGDGPEGGKEAKDGESRGFVLEGVGDLGVDTNRFVRQSEMLDGEAEGQEILLHR